MAAGGRIILGFGLQHLLQADPFIINNTVARVCLAKEIIWIICATQSLLLLSNSSYIYVYVLLELSSVLVSRCIFCDWDYIGSVRQYRGLLGFD